jgi:hypothetical protein
LRKIDSGKGTVSFVKDLKEDVVCKKVKAGRRVGVYVHLLI